FMPSPARKGTPPRRLVEVGALSSRERREKSTTPFRVVSPGIPRCECVLQWRWRWENQKASREARMRGTAPRKAGCRNPPIAATAGYYAAASRFVGPRFSSRSDAAAAREATASGARPAAKWLTAVHRTDASPRSPPCARDRSSPAPRSHRSRRAGLLDFARKEFVELVGELLGHLGGDRLPAEL